MTPQRSAFLVVLVAVVALSSVLFGDRVGGLDAAAPRTGEDQDQRALRLARYPTDGRPFNSTLTVVPIGKRLAVNHAHSAFRTHLLRSYGSGRLDFNIRVNVRCDRLCRGGDGAEPTGVEAPCLVVAPMECPLSAIKCHYPRCMTMVTSDETCRSEGGHDFRQYYSDRLSRGVGYLPLGPRADSWESFQRIQARIRFYVKAASQRKYAFNAVFSQSTNDRRKRLARIVEEGRGASDLNIFASMAREWTRDVNDPGADQVDTDEYVSTLLDSVFTLVPAGHNPESYRLYEAVEAGSIPVLTGVDLGDQHTRCQGSLRAWADAPVVILNSWENLFPRLEGLMDDPARLDERQVRLRKWYDDRMRRVVAGFEDRIVRTSLLGGERGAGGGGPKDVAEGGITAHPIWRTLNG